MNIFTVKDQQLTIHQPVIRAIPEFAAILRKRMPTKGDSEGRNKEMNLRVFMFIFFVSEFRDINPLAGEPEITRIPKAKEYAGLSDSWEPDDDVQAAINRYVEILTTLAPSVKLLVAAKQGVSQAADQIMMAVNQNQRILEKVKEATDAAFATDITSPDYGKQLEILQRMQEIFQGNIKDLRATVKDMSNMHNTVNEFEKTVSEQVAENIEIYGGGILNPREIPIEQRRGSFLS